MRRSILRSLGSAIAAVTLLVCFAGPSQAQKAQGDSGALHENTSGDLQACDGYGSTSRNGDGMTEDATTFWRTGGDRIRRAPALGATGIAYCTRALARLEAEFPQYWLRRVSLIQARALHRLATNDIDGALADLDLASQSAAEPQNAFYLRTLDLNAGFIRAFALTARGDRVGGETLAMQTWARRPHSREVIGAALVLLGQDGSQENIDALLRASGRVDPHTSVLAFIYAFEGGRFEQALATYPGLRPAFPAPTQSFIGDSNQQVEERVEREVGRRSTETFFQLHTIGGKAYALAALGRFPEARAAIEEGRVILAGAAPPPPALPTGRRVSYTDRTRQSVWLRVNAEIESRGAGIIDTWSTLVEARIAAGEGRGEQARTLLAGGANLPRTYALIDIYLASNPSLSQAERDAMLRVLPPNTAGLRQRSLQDLVGMLLDPETEDRSRANVGIMRPFMVRDAASRGNCQEERDEQDRATLCYHALDGTLAVTEERALLRAATLAAERGHPFFLIHNRDDIRHSMVTVTYGVSGPEQQLGYESRLEIRFADSNENCWRCIDATQIREQVGAVYAPASRAN